jgi:hypothetical protein
LRVEREDAFATKGSVMNSSNLALRMDADEGADEAPAGMPREGFAGTAASGARRGG